MRFFNFSRVGNAVLISKPELGDVRKPTNASDISKNVAKKSGFSRSDVDRILGFYLDEIAASLKDGRPVVLSGFGKFKLRKPRTGSCRNPNTGKKILAPQRKSVCFQPSLVIKQKLNAGEQKHG